MGTEYMHQGSALPNSAAKSTVDKLRLDLLISDGEKHSLSSRDPWKSLQSLVSLLCDPSHTVAIEAVQLLEDVATKENATSKNKRAEAVHAELLGGKILESATERGPLKEFELKLSDAVESQSPTILAILMAGLQDPKLRSACLRTMIRLTEIPQVYPNVIDTVASCNGLGNRSAFVREESADIIPFIFHSSWVLSFGNSETNMRLLKPLVKLLQDSDENVVDAATRAVNHLKIVDPNFPEALKLLQRPLYNLYCKHITTGEQPDISVEQIGNKKADKEIAARQLLPESKYDGDDFEEDIDSVADEKLQQKDQVKSTSHLNSPQSAQRTAASSRFGGVLDSRLVDLLTTTVDPKQRLWAANRLVDELNHLTANQLDILRTFSGPFLEVLSDLLNERGAKITKVSLRIAEVSVSRLGPTVEAYIHHLLPGLVSKLADSNPEIRTLCVHGVFSELCRVVGPCPLFRLVMPYLSNPDGNVRQGVLMVVEQGLSIAPEWEVACVDLEGICVQVSRLGTDNIPNVVNSAVSVLRTIQSVAAGRVDLQYILTQEGAPSWFSSRVLNKVAGTENHKFAAPREPSWTWSGDSGKREEKRSHKSVVQSASDSYSPHHSNSPSINQSTGFHGAKEGMRRDNVGIIDQQPRGQLGEEARSTRQVGKEGMEQKYKFLQRGIPDSPLARKVQGIENSLTKESTRRAKTATGRLSVNEEPESKGPREIIHSALRASTSNADLAIQTSSQLRSMGGNKAGKDKTFLWLPQEVQTPNREFEISESYGLAAPKLGRGQSDPTDAKGPQSASIRGCDTEEEHYYSPSRHNSQDRRPYPSKVQPKGKSRPQEPRRTEQSVVHHAPLSHQENYWPSAEDTSSQVHATRIPSTKHHGPTSVGGPDTNSRQSHDPGTYASDVSAGSTFKKASSTGSQNTSEANEYLSSTKYAARRRSMNPNELDSTKTERESSNTQSHSEERKHSTTYSQDRTLTSSYSQDRVLADSYSQKRTHHQGNMARNSTNLKSSQATHSGMQPQLHHTYSHESTVLVHASEKHDIKSSTRVGEQNLSRQNSKSSMESASHIQDRLSMLKRRSKSRGSTSSGTSRGARRVLSATSAKEHATPSSVHLKNDTLTHRPSQKGFLDLYDLPTGDANSLQNLLEEAIPAVKQGGSTWSQRRGSSSREREPVGIPKGEEKQPAESERKRYSPPSKPRDPSGTWTEARALESDTAQTRNVGSYSIDFTALGPDSNPFEVGGGGTPPTHAPSSQPKRLPPKLSTATRKRREMRQAELQAKANGPPGRNEAVPQRTLKAPQQERRQSLPPKLGAHERPGGQGKGERKYMSREELSTKKFKQPEHKLRDAIQSLKSTEWDRQFDALDIIRQLALQHPRILESEVHSCVLLVLKTLDNLRSSVSKNSLLTLKDMVFGLGKLMDPEIDAVLPAIVKKAGDTNAFLAGEAEQVVDTMIERCSQNRVLLGLLSCNSNKSAVYRAHHADMVRRCVSAMESRVNHFRELEKLIQCAAQYLGDSSSEARHSGKVIVMHLHSQGAIKENRLRQIMSSRQYKELMDRTLVVTPSTSGGSRLGTSLGDVSRRRRHSHASDEGRDSSLVKNKSGGPRGRQENRPTVATKVSNLPTLEGFNESMDSISSKDWRSRHKGLKKLTDIVVNHPSAVLETQQLMNVMDKLCGRVSDGNTKVTVLALECIGQVVPLLHSEFDAATWALLMPVLCNNMVASHRETQQVANHVMIEMLEYADCLVLVQNMIHVLQFSNPKVKTCILEKLAQSTVLERTLHRKRSVLLRTVVPRAFQLLDSAKGTARMANHALIRTLASLLGHDLITMSKSLPEHNRNRVLELANQVR